MPDQLRLAHDQFTHALSLEGVSHAEPWIYHFLLGKINWKLETLLQIVLNHFIKVSIYVVTILCSAALCTCTCHQFLYTMVRLLIEEFSSTCMQDVYTLYLTLIY